MVVFGIILAGQTPNIGLQEKAAAYTVVMFLALFTKKEVACVPELAQSMRIEKVEFSLR
jgi:hypothetical protein